MLNQRLIEAAGILINSRSPTTGRRSAGYSTESVRLRNIRGSNNRPCGPIPFLDQGLTPRTATANCLTVCGRKTGDGIESVWFRHAGIRTDKRPTRAIPVRNKSVLRSQSVGVADSPTVR
jgi:hypothetical protein